MDRLDLLVRTFPTASFKAGLRPAAPAAVLGRHYSNTFLNSLFRSSLCLVVVQKLRVEAPA